MKENQHEFGERLASTYPNLYTDMHGDPRVTCMAFGIAVRRGWWPIIEELSAKLEAIITEWKETYTDDEYYPRAAQVKEKFGTLRFYMTHHIDGFDGPIREAEGKSAVTCEKCGVPGKLRDTGWLFTLCDECHEARQKDPGFMWPD
jgi:hypothetical protein